MSASLATSVSNATAASGSESSSTSGTTQWSHVVRASSVNAILPPRTPRVAVAMVGTYMDAFLKAMVAFADRCRTLRFAATFKEDDIVFAKDVLLGVRAARIPKDENMKQPLVWSVLTKLIEETFRDASKRPAISKLARDAFQDATASMLCLLQERFRVCLLASSSKTLCVQDIGYVLSRPAEVSVEFGTAMFATDPEIYMDLIAANEKERAASASKKTDKGSETRQESVQAPVESNVTEPVETRPVTETVTTVPKKKKAAGPKKTDSGPKKTDSGPKKRKATSGTEEAPKAPRKRKASETPKKTTTKRTKKAQPVIE